MDKFPRLFFTVLIVLGTFVSGIMPLAAQTPESSTTFVSELTGSTLAIGISGGAFIDRDRHSQSDFDGYTEEVITVVHDSARIWVSFIEGDVTPDDWIEIAEEQALSSFVEGEFVGFDSGYEHSWILARGSIYLDIPASTHQEFYSDMANGGHVALLISMPEFATADVITWVQSNLTIDGKHLAGGPGIAEINAMIEGTARFEPIPMVFEESTVADWSDLGLVSESEWHNPDRGTEVTWDDSAIQFPFQHPGPIYYTEADQSHTLVLKTPGFTGYVFVTMGDIQDDRTMTEWINYWSSEDWLTNTNNYFPANGSKDLGTSGSVVYSFDTNFGEDGVMIREAFFDAEGRVTTVSIRTTPRNVAQVYTDVMNNLYIDGELIEPSWTTSELDEMFPTPSVQGDSDSSNVRTNRSDSPTPDTTPAPSRTSRQAPRTQQGEAFTSELTGAEIVLDSEGEAAFNHEEHDVTTGADVSKESVMVERGNSFIFIEFLDSDVSPTDYMEQSGEAIAARYPHTELLGTDFTTSSSWGLFSRAYYLDYREYIYVDFHSAQINGVHVSIGVYGSETDLVHDISWFQENISIDGNLILQDADLTTIDEMITGSDAVQPEVIANRPSTVSDWEDEGLVSETRWQSPISDISITWDGNFWAFPFYRDDGIHVGDGVTMLILESTDRTGKVNLWTLADDDDPDTWVDQWTRQAEEEGSGQKILGSATSGNTGSVIIQYSTTFGEPVIAIRDVYVADNGTAIVTEIYAAPENIANVYTEFWDNVQSNGDYYPLTWTIEEIESIGIE